MLSHSFQFCIAPAQTFQKKLLDLFSNRSHASLQLVEALITKPFSDLFFEMLPQETNRKFRLFALDATSTPRIHAHTLDDRSYVHQANQIGQGYTRPWHKKRDSTKPAGPGEVKRLFATRIFPVLGSPTRLPISCEKSRGRELGARFPKRTRKKVIKKHKLRRKAA